MVCHLPDKNNTDAKIVKVRMLYTPTLHVGSLLFLYPPSGNSHGCGLYWSFYCPWIVSVPFIITIHFYCHQCVSTKTLHFAHSLLSGGHHTWHNEWVSLLSIQLHWLCTVKEIWICNNDFMFSFVTTGEKDWHSLTWTFPMLSQKRCQGTANGNVMPWNGILTFRMLISLLML